MHPPTLPSVRSSAARSVRAGLLLAFVAGACRTAAEPASTRTTDGGRFVLHLQSSVTPIPLNRIHSWRLHVARPDGTPVEGATITIQGGMPAHSHGLPTVPEVAPAGSPGDYIVEGMKFSMPGHWVLTPTVWADGARDAVTFELDLP